jgi:hypothetical protein
MRRHIRNPFCLSQPVHNGFIGAGTALRHGRRMQYTADRDLFVHVEKVGGAQFVEDDWTLLTCKGRNGASILLSDIGLDAETDGSRAQELRARPTWGPASAAMAMRAT